MKIKTLALAGAAAVALSAAAVGSAQVATAEPNGAPTFRALAGVGSDTTQEVVNGLSDVVLAADGTTKLIASYNADGGGNIKTKEAGCDFARPNGSSAGRNALLASLTAGSATAGCVDFARSSALNLASASTQLTYVPFAVDALTFAVSSSSEVPRNLSLDQVKAIYRCENVGAAPLNALIPQAGSGTRQSWLALMGLTETTKGSCVKDVNNGQPVQEHDGRAVTGPRDIAPFSVAQYIAQSFGAQTDRRGTVALGAIDGKVPLLLNTDVPGARTVYNIIPTAKEGVSPIAETFVGPTSKVCASSATIQRFGFGLSPQCGSVTNRTATAQ